MSGQAARAWLACAVVLASVPASAQAGGDGAAPCAGITASAVPADAHSPTDKGFSARRVLDIAFHVELAPEAAPESLVLKVFTPNGHLFQSVDVPIASSAAEKERALPGYRFPVKVAQARAGRATGGRVVDTPTLAVAGTDIVANSLYGRWRVEAWVKDASSACSAHFNILQ